MAPWTPEQHSIFLQELESANPNTSAVPGRSRDQFISHRQSYRASVKRVIDSAAKASNMDELSLSKSTQPSRQISYFISLCYLYFQGRNQKHPTLFNTPASMTRRIQESLRQRGINWPADVIEKASSSTMQATPGQPLVAGRSAPAWANLYREQQSILTEIRNERDQLQRDLVDTRRKLMQLEQTMDAPSRTQEDVRQAAEHPADYQKVLEVTADPESCDLPPYAVLMLRSVARLLMGNFEEGFVEFKASVEAEPSGLAKILPIDE